jgi:hypothetical protein
MKKSFLATGAKIEKKIYKRLALPEIKYKGIVFCALKRIG